MSKSDLERSLLFFLKVEGLPTPETEVRFHPTRKWRFDFAWPNQRVAAEVEGGIYVQGRHSRGPEMEKDMEKYNAATALGWKLFRFSNHMVEDGRAIETLKKVLG